MTAADRDRALVQALRDEAAQDPDDTPLNTLLRHAADALTALAQAEKTGARCPQCGFETVTSSVTMESFERICQERDAVEARADAAEQQLAALKTVPTLTEADIALLQQIELVEPTGRALADALHAYYRDAARAERTPRYVLYLHMGLLTGTILRMLEEHDAAEQHLTSALRRLQAFYDRATKGD